MSVDYTGMTGMRVDRQAEAGETGNVGGRKGGRTTCSKPWMEIGAWQIETGTFGRYRVHVSPQTVESRFHATMYYSSNLCRRAVA